MSTDHKLGISETIAGGAGFICRLGDEAGTGGRGILSTPTPDVDPLQLVFMH